jgi:uncharacterized C2H2 Zn-finger protein
MTEREVVYRVKPVNTVSDGEYLRIIAEYDGRFSRGESPRHIERLSVAQARTLRDSLNDQLGNSGPRKWTTRDGDDVAHCTGCGATWVASTLYTTGDVLRCPGCDGVMRP